MYSNDFLEFKQYRKKTFLMNWYFNYKDGTNNLRLDPNANNAKILHNLINIINNLFDYIIIIVINV